MEWTAESAKQRNAAAVAQCARDGFIRNLAMDYVDASGRITPVEINATVQGEGDALRIISLCRDITERKRAEAALRESEQHLRSVVMAAPVVLWDLDAAGTLLLSEGRALARLGLKAGGRVGQSVFELYRNNPDALALIRRGLAGEDFSAEVQAGGRHWSNQYVPRRDEKGNVLGLIGVSVDITERKRAEEALAAAAKEWQATFDSSTDLIAVIDRDRRVVRTNLEMRKRLAGQAAEGRLCYDVVHGTDRPPTGCRSCDVFTSRTPQQFVFQEPNLGGRWFNVGVFPIIDSDGQVTHVAHVMRDITDERLLEERLRQMQKMDAIGQLAGGVAHDFNNQLTAVLGYAELLVHRLDDSNLKRYASNIYTAAQRSADLTRKLLAFARKGQYQSIPVDMHHVIAEAVEMLQHSIDKRIRVEQLLRAQPTVVTGDPSQLVNALLNLGLNARDAMPDGGTLTFETQIVNLDAEFCNRHPHELQPGHFFLLAVTDTGYGMSDEVKQHLFEPFFTTKPIGKGTGMGLLAQVASP